MERLLDKNCIEFSEALAAKVSVPGGGGAAAYVGALGIALGNMAANYTTGKKKFIPVQQDLDRILVDAQQIRINLLDLVQKDALAFEPLSKAYAIGKDDPNRNEILEQATMTALQAPLDMVKECAKAIDVLDELSHKCSKLLISDVACGASLCRCAMESASLNVFINTKSLNNREQAVQIENEVDSILVAYLPKAQNIVDRITKEMRG